MVRKALLLVVLALVVPALMISCGGKDKGVVAKVGKEKITADDFNLAYAGITVFNRPPLVTYEDYEKFLNTLINKELMINAAKEEGLDKEKAFLDLKERWEREAAVRALQKEVTESDVEFTLDEVKDYYVRSGTVLRVRHILLEDLATAEEVYKKLEAGADFAKMVKDHSLDESTVASGGDAGEIRRGILSPEIEEVLFSLNEGEISEPVQSMRGYHILNVTSRTVPSMDDFEANRAATIQQLRVFKKNQNWKKYLDQARESLGMKFNEENIAYLNGLLPGRDEAKGEWSSALTEADRSRVLLTSERGEITIATALEYWDRPDVMKPFQTPDGSLVKSSLERWLVGDMNYDEAIRRNLKRDEKTDLSLAKRVEEYLVTQYYNHLTESVEVTDEMIREEYETRKDELILEDRANLAMINVSNRSAAEEALSKLKAGVPFETVSNEYNSGALVDLKGVLGLRTAQSIPTELHSYAFERLQVGDLTPVVPHAKGFFVAELIEKDPTHKMSFEEAKEALRKVVLERERDALLMAWTERQREEGKVTIYGDALTALMEEKAALEEKIEETVEPANEPDAGSEGATEG